MGQTPGVTSPRVVLDTNCVVSALLFQRGRCAWLRVAWQSVRFVPLASHATARELLRVLNYPKFGLTADEQSVLLADYLPWVETVLPGIPATGQAGHARPPAPRFDIRDPSDRIFLELAYIARADALVSGDGDVLAAGPSPLAPMSAPILRVSEFADWLDRRG